MRLALLVFSFHLVTSCQEIFLEVPVSSMSGVWSLFHIQSNERPSYRSISLEAGRRRQPLYLYHVESAEFREGYWIAGPRLGGGIETAVAYVQSWALSPMAVSAPWNFNELSRDKIHLDFLCHETPLTLHVWSALHSTVAGFYLPTGRRTDGAQVYRRIGTPNGSQKSDRGVLLRYQSFVDEGRGAFSGRWIISAEDDGENTEGLAFVNVARHTEDAFSASPATEGEKVDLRTGLLDVMSSPGHHGHDNDRPPLWENTEDAVGANVWMIPSDAATEFSSSTLAFPLSSEGNRDEWMRDSTMRVELASWGVDNVGKELNSFDSEGDLMPDSNAETARAAVQADRTQRSRLAGGSAHSQDRRSEEFLLLGNGLLMPRVGFGVGGSHANFDSELNSARAEAACNEGYALVDAQVLLDPSRSAALDLWHQLARGDGVHMGHADEQSEQHLGEVGLGNALARCRQAGAVRQGRSSLSGRRLERSQAAAASATATAMSSDEDVWLTARVPLLPPSLLVAFAEAFDNFDEAAAEEATRILFSHVFDETYFGILSMLGRLQRSHVELLLLPLPGHLTSAFLPTNSETTLSRIRALPESTKARAGLEVWRARWRAMEKLCDEGRVLSLGLADAHLKEGSGVESLGLDSEVQWAQTLLRYARIRPVVLQARFDPLTLKSREELGLSSKHSGLPSLLRWCSDEGIAVQARSLLRRAAREDYADSGVASSSLMQGGRVSGALHGSRGDGDIMSEHFDYLHVRQELAQVARTLGRDAFQVLIKWCLDVAGPALLESSSSSRHGPVPNFAVVVRSGSLHHRLLNLDVFGWDLPLQSLGSVLSRPLDVQKVENAKFSPSNDDEPRRTAAFSKSRRERENFSPPKTSLPPEAVSRHTGGGRRDVKELRASLLASKTSSVEAERQHRVDAAAATQLLEEATRRRVAAAAAEDGRRVAESEGGHSSILQNKNTPLADSERPRSSRWARWRYIAGAGAAALALAVLTTALSGMLPINSSTKLPAQPVKHGGSPRDGTPTVKPKPSRAIMRSKSMAEPRDPIPDEPDTGDLLAATDGGFFPGSNEDTDDDDDGNFFTPHHQHTPHEQRNDDPWSSSASLTFSSGNGGGCSGTNTGLSERKFSRAKSLSAISLSDSGTFVGAVGRAVVNAVSPIKGSRKPLLPLALPEDLAKNKET